MLAAVSPFKRTSVFASASKIRRPVVPQNQPLCNQFRTMASAPKDAGKPPFPPFTRETALIKVRAGQDLWNTKNPSIVKNGYTPDSIWRNRDTFLRGSDEIVEFLTKKWSVENGYRLRKELFAFTDNKIAVQFWYEWYDTTGQWWRTYGLEDWTYAEDGRMRKRQMSGNDVKISDEERWFKDGVDVNEVEISEKHW